MRNGTMQFFDTLFQDNMAPASLGILMQEEQSRLCFNDYLNQSSQGTLVTASDRTRMIDWIYSVIDQLQYDRETVAIATQIIDHFLSKRSNTADRRYLQDRHQFQLLGIAAMYVAIKSNESVAISSTQVEQMVGGVYSSKCIEDMELILLNDLDWRLVAPTSLQMAQHVLALIFPHVYLNTSLWSFLYDQVRFNTECSVRDYQMSTQMKPSTVAVAAILSAADGLGFQVSENVYDALQLVMEEAFPHSQVLVAARNLLDSLVDVVNERLREHRSIPRTVSYEHFEA